MNVHRWSWSYMDTIDLLVNAVTSAYEIWRSDPNGRHRSWEHCYKNFHDARHQASPNYDYLSLQLAFYLASWGMYRGSSFLLQKDYRIHIPIVEEILKPQYNCLFGIECIALETQEVQDSLKKLESVIEKYYDGIRRGMKVSHPKYGLSTTLITKILMGTLGCVPAYDRYFVEGIKSQRVTTGNYNISSLLGLANFYEHNHAKLEATRKNLKAYDLLYPQMKLLDVGFWLIGVNRDLENSDKK